MGQWLLFWKNGMLEKPARGRRRMSFQSLVNSDGK